MTELSRMDKLKKVCIDALSNYKIKYKNIEFFSEDTNVFFKIEAVDDVYMLKIFQEESSKIEDNIAEVFFMKYIDEVTDITLPTIVPSATGDDIVIINSPHFELDKRIVLYKFMDGDNFDSNETIELFEKLGETTAMLHNASEKLIIPSHIKPKRWDNVFYYRDEPIVYNDELYKDITLEENRLFLDKFIPYLNQKLVLYYERPSFIIHADLNPWNVKIHNNEIRLLDFEEAMLASEIHDLAIILFYYRYDKNFDYENVKKHLFKGYQKKRALPEFTEFDLDLLIMARTANFVNYVLYLEDDPTTYFRTRCDRMKQFVNKYNIKL